MLVPPTVVSSVVVGSVVVGSAVAGSAVAGSAAASSSGAGTDGQRQPHRVCYFWIALGSFVFARCGGYEKTPDFTRAIVQSTLNSSLVFLQHRRHTSADVYPTDLHHNEIEQDTF